MANTPEKKFRAGAVAATVWRNQTTNTNGEQTHYYTVSVDRSYRDKNGEWKKTSSFRESDLPRAALVINKAYEYLMLEAEKNNAQSTPSTAAPPTAVEDMDVIM